DRVRAHRDAESRARWVQGSRRGRRDRRASGRRERGRRRARTARRRRHPPPALTATHRRTREGPGPMGDLSYDPYTAIKNHHPYPLYQRLRDEAPLYYNEDYDFYAVSRYDDCERGLVDAKRFISGRGGILELIKANIEMPPGNLIFEDPPAHTVHR